MEEEKFCLGAGPHRGEVGRIVNEFAAAKDWNEKVSEFRGRCKMFAAGDVGGIDNGDGGGERPRFIVNGVADESVVTGETTNLKHAGIGDFGGLFGEFDFVIPFAVLFFNSGEFVNAAESGLIVSGDELGAD